MADVKSTGDPLAFPTPEECRAWLDAHHASAEEAWVLISKKHGGSRLVSLVEATEEALCFGWIDSAMRPIDTERFALRYTPRRQASKWSPTNRARVERLIEEGRMTEAGLEKLAAYGVAPPARRRDDGPVPLQLSVRCPQCGSLDTRESSRFGSTACKSLWLCRSCREPFDHFKPL